MEWNIFHFRETLSFFFRFFRTYEVLLENNKFFSCFILACTDLFENLSVNSLKGDLSNATTFKLPLFSVDNTFKYCINVFWLNQSLVYSTLSTQIAPNYLSGSYALWSLKYEYTSMRIFLFIFCINLVHKLAWVRFDFWVNFIYPYILKFSVIRVDSAKRIWFSVDSIQEESHSPWLKMWDFLYT